MWQNSVRMAQKKWYCCLSLKKCLTNLFNQKSYQEKIHYLVSQDKRMNGMNKKPTMMNISWHYLFILCLANKEYGGKNTASNSSCQNFTFWIKTLLLQREIFNWRNLRKRPLKDNNNKNKKTQPYNNDVQIKCLYRNESLKLILLLNG